MTTTRPTNKHPDSVVPPFRPDTTVQSAVLHNAVRNVDYVFPFNINSLQWQYVMNTQSFDTIGGRVTQLLSVQISTMYVIGETGGQSVPSRKKGASANIYESGRGALLQLYSNFKQAQDDQNQQKTSMRFSVPSRGLSWVVWLQEMQIAWDPTVVSYQYQMSFQVDQEIGTSATKAITSSVLDQMATGVGFSPQWTGLDAVGTSIKFSDIQQYFPVGS